jgi:hypothetical protein
VVRRVDAHELISRLRATLAVAIDSARAKSTPKSTIPFLAAALSVLMHVALLIVVISANVRSGDPNALPVVLVDNFAPRSPVRNTQRADLEDPPPLASEEQFAQPSPITDAIDAIEDPTLDTQIADSLTPALEPLIPTPTLIADVDEAAATFIDGARSEPAPPTPPAIDLPRVRKIEIAPEHQTTLAERLTKAAEALMHASTAEIAWSENGREYRAVLNRAIQENNMELERISADVTTTDQGMSMQTRVLLSRIAFSQFTQVVDRWDPNVQLHDDEIVGRFHSNSSLLIANDSSATPKFTGKVTTAARGMRFMNGVSRKRRAEMFQGGLQTFAGRIELPKESAPFVLQPPSDDAHVQRFTDDAHITLHGDGSYSWQARTAQASQTLRYAIDESLYLLAAPNATLFLKGTVRGRVLAYSPKRIVIEGSLVYANDPRTNDDADDYLGLVSDGNVEIARSYVTGRGDLRIDGAIFARRRFLVADIDRRQSGKLWIYGSLTAGTISATEPRYATKIEFDQRFDRMRPPGFPSTNRFEVASWNPQWREASTAH